jgi:UbiD family decarboxylase
MQIYDIHPFSHARREIVMPYQDFRQFLDVLRQHGELIDVNRPVALNDVGKAMKQSYVRQGPAIMFNQNGTDYPLVAGVYPRAARRSSRSRRTRIRSSTKF